MSKEADFLAYCVEVYKLAKKMKGKEVWRLFQKYRVPEYVTYYYEALHTTGSNYIVDDIDLYIEARMS